MDEIKSKASILVEALPYVRRFRGSIFVVKYGGSFMDSPNPEVRSQVAQDLVFLHFVGIILGVGRRGALEAIGQPFALDAGVKLFHSIQ